MSKRWIATFTLAIVLGLFGWIGNASATATFEPWQSKDVCGPMAAAWCPLTATQTFDAPQGVAKFVGKLEAADVNTVSVGIILKVNLNGHEYVLRPSGLNSWNDAKQVEFPVTPGQAWTLTITNETVESYGSAQVRLEGEYIQPTSVPPTATQTATATATTTEVPPTGTPEPTPTATTPVDEPTPHLPTPTTPVDEPTPVSPTATPEPPTGCPEGTEKDAQGRCASHGTPWIRVSTIAPCGIDAVPVPVFRGAKIFDSQGRIINDKLEHLSDPIIAVDGWSREKLSELGLTNGVSWSKINELTGAAQSRGWYVHLGQISGEGSARFVQFDFGWQFVPNTNPETGIEEIASWTAECPNNAPENGCVKRGDSYAIEEYDEYGNAKEGGEIVEYSECTPPPPAAPCVLSKAIVDQTVASFVSVHGEVGRTYVRVPEGKNFLQVFNPKTGAWTDQPACLPQTSGEIDETEAFWLLHGQELALLILFVGILIATATWQFATPNTIRR